jgi:Rieske Fe-S protein
VLTLSFSQYPQLASVAGSVTVSALGYSDPICGSDRIIVIQKASRQYVALSAVCPHACCEVFFTGSTPWALRCPCHGAEFDLTGKSAGRKTSRPLASLPVCGDTCAVYITLP